MTAVWTVVNENFDVVPGSASSSRIAKRNKPKAGEVLTVVITGLSHCKCILTKYAQEGKLNGPTSVVVDALEVSSSTETSLVTTSKSYYNGLKQKMIAIVPESEHLMIPESDSECDEEQDSDCAGSSPTKRRNNNAAELIVSTV